ATVNSRRAVPRVGFGTIETRANTVGSDSGSRASPRSWLAFARRESIRVAAGPETWANVAMRVVPPSIVTRSGLAVGSIGFTDRTSPGRWELMRSPDPCVQPTKRHPAAGVAVRTTLVPSVYRVWSGVLVTEPLPSTATSRV